MATKIYTMPLSQPARALSWACLYEGTAVEEVQTMPGKGTRTKEFMAQGAIPHVPRLQEGDFILNECHAIMCYLGDKHHWKLYPKDARTRARIHQYMNWHHQNTRRITLALFAPVMRPDIKFPKDLLASWNQDVPVALKTLERWLSESPWLCGDQPTVADLSCYCEVGQCLDKFTGLFAVCGVDMEKFPRIRKWLDECEKLPGFDASHAALKQVGPGIRGKAVQYFAKL